VSEASGSKEGGQLSQMAPQEWDAFWGAVECCMLLQTGQGAGYVDERSAKRARTNRCGQCVGCNRGDCGTCKNCKDKPKFGGPGVKKQACVRRACNNPLADRGDAADEDDEDDGDTAPHYYEYAGDDATMRGGTSDGVGGFMSGGPSPDATPTSGPAHAPLGAVAPLELDGRSRRAVAAGTSSMEDETRRRLKQLRQQRVEPSREEEGRSSSLSTGYDTADEEDAAQVPSTGSATPPMPAATAAAAAAAAPPPPVPATTATAAAAVAAASAAAPIAAAVAAAVAASSSAQAAHLGSLFLPQHPQPVAAPQRQIVPRPLLVVPPVHSAAVDKSRREAEAALQARTVSMRAAPLVAAPIATAPIAAKTIVAPLLVKPVVPRPQ
jgi:hypothetical protein